MKAVVFTLGCKVNECESDSLIAGLLDRGFEVTDKLEKADIYIVNTCAVTAEAEKKSRQMNARISHLNPNAKVFYMGCASQKNPKNFIDKKNTSLVIGTFNKGEILNMLDKTGVCLFDDTLDFEELQTVKTFRTRTYIKVEDGCNNFCSYCIIPYLRGRERSRNPQNIISEIEQVSPKEAVINGINLSAYNYNGTNLTGLMKELKDVDTRIRLGSLEVNVITREFLESLKELKNFAEQFHLSLQSGSNAVLKKMNRHYTREEYIKRCDLIREYFPNAGITTDIIAGFPTETEDDFNDTLSLIDRAKFSDIHPFIYSPRSGTVAYKMQDLPHEIKKARLDKLLIKKAICKDNFFEKEKDIIQQVIFEDFDGIVTGGYTGNYIRVYADGNLSGKICKVKLKSKYLDGVKAEIIE